MARHRFHKVPGRDGSGPSWVRNSTRGKKKTQSGSRRGGAGGRVRGGRRGNRYSFMEAMTMTMEYLSRASAWDDGIDDDELLGLDLPIATTQASPDDVLLGTVKGNIVGLQYYTGTVNNGEMVSLVREPNNPYDRNAVKVENMWGDQVGHIKRKLAEALSYIMDNNYARIDGVVPRGNQNTFTMPVDISLWGPPANKTVVTQRLGSRGFHFMQDWAGLSGAPSQSKSKKSTTYNPRSTLGKSVILSEAEMRNEVDTLFDHLKSLDKTTEKEPNKCITSLMYPHQKQALNWMLAREVDDNLPPFWEQKTPLLFHNSLTNFSTVKRPESVRGGILADEMGLGKTLSVIALILHGFVPRETSEEGDEVSPALPSLQEMVEEQVVEVESAAAGDQQNGRREVPPDGGKPTTSKASQNTEENLDEIIILEGSQEIVVPMTIAEEVIVLDDEDSQEKALEVQPPATVAKATTNTVIASATTTSTRPKRASAANIRYVFSDESDEFPSPEKKPKMKPSQSTRVAKVKGQSAKGKGGKSKKCEVAPPIPSTQPINSQPASKPAVTSQPLPAKEPITALTGSSAPIRTAAVRGEGGDSSKPRPTLIICPLSVLSNWIDQFAEHVSDAAQVSVCLYYGAERKKTKAADLKRHDVIITTYNTMAAEFKAKKEKATLHSMEWHRVVLDEAHTIRNPGTLQTQAAHTLKAQCKWALTGTPIQNSIKDLWSLVAFLGLEPFKSTHNWWQRIIARPIAQNDSRGIDRVRKLMETLALRRMKSQKVDGKPLVDLPARNVVLQYIDFSQDEKEVYKTMEKDGRLAVSKYFQEGTTLDHYGHILAIIMRLRQLCCHPGLCAKAAAKLCDAAMSEGSEKTDEEKAELVATLVSFLSQGADEECCICLESIQSPVITRCAHVFCQQCISEVIVAEKEAARCPLCRRPVSRATLVHVPRDKSGTGEENTEGEWHSSAKVDALMECLLRERAADKSTKSIVVSQFTTFLDLLKKPLTEKGFTFTRLDGSMSNNARMAAIRDFSRSDPDSPQIFLLSLKAGGVGLNLTAASRLYLLDPAWNPACEEQCFDRCHRLGQTKDVTITKFLVRDTVEEAMLQLQETKRQLMKRVFDGKKQTPEERRANRVRDIKILMGFNTTPATGQ